MAQIRLDKYLADAGIGTRSQVKQYIKKETGHCKQYPCCIRRS